MDGTTAQARIYAGYAKTAARMGQPYAQYRAASPITPIAGGNLLRSLECVFAPTDTFRAPHAYKQPTRIMFADGRLLAQNDILVGPYGTFFVADMQPLLPIEIIWCNDSLAIQRLTYSGSTQVQAFTQVATALPAFVMLKKVDQKSVTGIGGASTASTAIGEFFAFMPIAHGVVLQGDVVTVAAGVAYTLDTIDNTESGVVITMHQAESV